MAKCFPMPLLAPSMRQHTPRATITKVQVTASSLTCRNQFLQSGAFRSPQNKGRTKYNQYMALTNVISGGDVCELRLHDRNDHQGRYVRKKCKGQLKS